MNPQSQPPGAAEEIAWERSVLHGLAEQWGAEIRSLPWPLQRALRPPLFRLADLAGEWGHWDPAQEMITFSRHLARDYAWACVRDVLLHEIAHQVADTLWGGAGRPHGALFAEACRLLGIPPEDSRARPTLNFGFRSAAPAGPARAADLVRKLLALAQSANPHEAALAMAKARSLMARHQMELAGNVAAEPFNALCVGLPALRHYMHENLLAGLLRDHYFVRGIWVPIYMPDRGRMGSVLELLGRPENLRMAEYVHAFVLRYVDDQWHAFQSGRGRGSARRLDFALGVVRGFRDQLDALRGTEDDDTTPAPPRTQALARMESAALDKFFRYRYPRIRMQSSGSRQVHAASLEAGHRAGREIELHRPVTAAAGAPQLPARTPRSLPPAR